MRRERWGRRRSREKRYVITHRVPHPAPLQISKHNGGFDVSPGRKRTVATLCPRPAPLAPRRRNKEGIMAEREMAGVDKILFRRTDDITPIAYAATG